jgi:hypothetical protein
MTAPNPLERIGPKTGSERTAAIWPYLQVSWGRILISEDLAELDSRSGMKGTSINRHSHGLNHKPGLTSDESPWLAAAGNQLL